MQKTTIYIEEETYRQLKQIARRRGAAPAEVVREALRDFTARHARRAKPRSIGAFKSGMTNLGQRAEDLLGNFGKDQ